MKLLHPDGKATDDELAEYVSYAVEARQRVKDQLSVMAPGEYPQYTIEYEIGARRAPAAPPERGRRRALRIPGSPQIGVVVGLAVAGETAGTIQLIEVLAQKGHGALNRLGSMGKAMKESVKAAFEFVSNRRRSLNIVSELKDGYDLSILALQGAVPKEGPSAGLAFAIGIISAVTHRKVRNDVAVTGEITLHGNILAVGGLAQKIAAARDAGSRVVILPKDNEREVREFPPDVYRGLRLVFVDKADDAFEEVFC
jgi:ATP-dependent Lon protease